MIRLDTYQRKLQALLGGAIATSQPTVVVSYTDIENESQKKFFVEAVTSTLNSTTPIDILPAPDKAMVREVDSIHIRNNDTAAATITVRINDNGTNYELVEVTIQSGETLVYTDSEGWKVITVYGNSASVFGYIDFDTNATPPLEEGRLYWDSGDGSLTLGLKGGNTALQLGQENVALAYNDSGVTITAGSVVAVSGAQGQRPKIVLADADTEPLSAATLGIAAESISNGAEGFVCTFGLVRGIDTSTFTAGNPIYLSQTAGQFTATRPSAPAHTVFLGWVIKVNASSGEVFVNISNGWELDELHNVLISSPVDGQTLTYDSGLWKNITVAPQPWSINGSDIYYNSGNVGIGTSSPEFKLVVNQATTYNPTGLATANSTFHIISEAANNGWMEAYGTGGIAINGRAAGGTSTSPSAIAADRQMMAIGARGYGTSQWSNAARGLISIHAAEAFTDTANGTYIAFATTPTGSTTRSERVRITAAGDLGVGTISPGEKLHVIGAMTTGGQATANKTSAGTFDFYATDNAARILSWGSSGVGGNISFWTGLGGSGTTEKVRIDSTGNVGIGRVPTYSLDVNSTARFNSTIGVGNTAPSASGAGISFPATQSASTDANTLDDYEENTWTPTDGSGAGLSFTDVTAKYTKIGNVVTVFAKLTYPTTASAAQAKIDGLPFAATDGGQLMYCSSSTTTTGFGQGYIVAGTTTATLVTQTSASRPNSQLSTLVLYFTGTYLT